MTTEEDDVRRARNLAWSILENVVGSPPMYDEQTVTMVADGIAALIREVRAEMLASRAEQHRDKVVANYLKMAEEKHAAEAEVARLRADLSEKDEMIADLGRDLWDSLDSIAKALGIPDQPEPDKPEVSPGVPHILEAASRLRAAARPAVK